MTLIVVLCLAGVLALLLWRLRRGAAAPSGVTIIGASASILALTALAIVTSAPRGDIRLSAEALVLRPVGGRLDVSVGGAPAQDELVIRPETATGVHPVAAQLLRIVSDATGKVDLYVNYAEAETPAVVQIGGVIAGARPLGDDDIICISACEGANAIRIRHDESSGTLQRVDTNALGPELERSDALFGWRFRDWLPQTRIYPLRHFLPAIDAHDADARQDLNTFLYRDAQSRLQIVVLDANVTIEGPPPSEPAPAAQFCSAAGACLDDLSVRVFAIRHGDSPLEADPLLTPQPGRLSELRSFTVLDAGSGAVRLNLDTPTSIELPNARLRDESQRLGANVHAIRIAAGAIATTDVEAAMSTVGFPALGGAYLRSLDYQLHYDSSPLGIARRDAPQPVANGEALELGAPNAAAFIRFEQLDGKWPPLQFAPLIVLLAGLASLIATWPSRASSSAAFALWTMLDLLLAFRVLVAIEAAYVDPSVEAQTAPALALAIFIVSPLVISLFDTTLRAVPLRRFAHAIFAFCAIGIVTTRVGPLSMPVMVVCLLAITTPALLALYGFVKRRLPPFRFGASKAPKQDTLLGAGFYIFVGIVVAFRLALIVAFQVEEAITVPTRISVSVFYVPITVWIFARLFASWRAGGSESSPLRHLALFAGTAFILIALPLSLAHDLGAFIYALPIVVFAAALGAERRDAEASSKRWIALSLLGIGALFSVWALLQLFVMPSAMHASALAYVQAHLVALIIGVLGLVFLVGMSVQRTRTLFALPAAALLALLAIVNIAPTSENAAISRIERAANSADTEDDVRVIEEAQRYNVAHLRLLNVLDDGALAGVGTTRAEGQAVAFAHMGDHARDAWGPGYLAAAAPTSAGLLAFHMDDNVPSVHVMGPFGRLVGALLVLCLFVAMAIVVQRRPASTAPSAITSYYVGALAVGTLTLVSAYMFLGNLEAAPFTGRNVYLLSVRSMSDVAEAWALFALAIASLGVRDQ